MPRKISPYNRFFAKHRKQGKSAKQIGKLWKSSASRSSRAPAKRKKTTRTASRTRSKVASKKLLGNMSVSGAGEDLAWGFVGLTLLGHDAAVLPSTRFIQGATGYLMKRRGKSRLVPALIDLVDLYLAGATDGKIPLVTQVQQLIALSPFGN